MMRTRRRLAGSASTAKPSLGLTLATGVFALLALAADARAAGVLVDCLQPATHEDMIPGVTFGDQPYVEYRCRIQGSLALPYDDTHGIYTYDRLVWIITPACPGDGNGTVIVDPFHTQNVDSPLFPSGAEGELPQALKYLGPRFLFRQGSYTWVGVSWDIATLTSPYRQQKAFDHVYTANHGVSLGSLGGTAAQQNYVGIAMLADLADAVRAGSLTMRGEICPRSFARVERVFVHGQSQTARTLRLLQNEPPSLTNGGGAHHVPLFDGWLTSAGLGPALGQYPQWPTIAADGEVHERPNVLRTEPTPRENGLVIDLGAEEDLSGGVYPTGGFEFLRFAPTSWHRSYEIAGGSHRGWAFASTVGRAGGAIFLPDLADTVAEQIAIAAADPNYVPLITDAMTCTGAHPLFCVNPLDWNPVVRASFVALEAWARDGTPPPPDVWLARDGGGEDYGVALPLARDAVGNALGGIRLPVVEVGRGIFFAKDPDGPPFAGGSVLAGAYVDRSAAFASRGAYVLAIARQVGVLVQAGFLLPNDGVLIIAEAWGSRVGGSD